MYKGLPWDRDKVRTILIMILFVGISVLSLISTLWLKVLLKDRDYLLI